MSASIQPTPTLLAANQKLHSLRQAHQASCQHRHAEGVPLPVPGTHHALSNAQQTLKVYQQRDGVASRSQLGMNRNGRFPAPITPPSPRQSPKLQTATTVKHYPSLGIAVLKNEQAAPYRVWLACRHLDEAGQGCLPINRVRTQLTDKKSKLRLVGWRRLRQILGQGHGRFWRWDKENGRLWLYGAARTAAKLEVERLAGHSVLLPLTAVSHSLGQFKAHLYAAWHSGRKESPVSRAVQAELMGVPERTQRHYCQQASVQRTTNIAIGAKATHEAKQEAAWGRGGAAFEFIDVKGKQGKRNGRYIAWQLPNSYQSIHQTARRGRQRKINRRLKDLVQIGTQGNESQPVARRYFHSGKDAARVSNQRSVEERYWKNSENLRGSSLWFVSVCKNF